MEFVGLGMGCVCGQVLEGRSQEGLGLTSCNGLRVSACLVSAHLSEGGPVIKRNPGLGGTDLCSGGALIMVNSLRSLGFHESWSGGGCRLRAHHPST